MGKIIPPLIALLALASPVLLAEDTLGGNTRDWLAPLPSAQANQTPETPGVELLPGDGKFGVPDEHGISSTLREAIRRESERALNPVIDELSTL